MDMIYWSYGVKYGMFSGVVPLMSFIYFPLFQTGIFIVVTLFFLYRYILGELEMVKTVSMPTGFRIFRCYIWPDQQAFLPKTLNLLVDTVVGDTSEYVS